MALSLTPPLQPDAVLLVFGVLLDLAIGDPVYRWHPVRLIGTSVAAGETFCRRLGADGYAGGIMLFLGVAAAWTLGISVALGVAAAAHPWLGAALHLFFLYTFLALGDLLRHVWRVERASAAGDLPSARVALSQLVGRDTARLDAAGCRRAAIESLAESLTDGFVSPLFWYALAGLPGLVVFKVASTMDSMVGYRTPRYLRFGWCGARVDDVMNWIPARMTWLCIAGAAAVLPGYSAGGALRVGLAQHGLLPGPNAGWSEAATAGALRRRLVGPVWKEATLVTDVWIGHASDPPAGEDEDVRRAIVLITGAGLAAAAALTMILIGT